jgi:DNA-binding NtrC family response regulator
MNPSSGHSLDEMLASYERIVILETLRRNDWNRRRAAEALKISRRRLTYRMAALHFDLGAIPRDLPGRRRRPDASKVVT